ncbi:MAG: hypothetical protein WC889_02910 [Myxococcota bacterium]|jgi:hypothetical protein
MSPSTRSAIEQQCRYITNDTSVLQNIQALHDRTVTLRDIAHIRAHLKVIRPQGRPAPSYGSNGPIIGPSEREFVVKAALADCNERFVRKLVETRQIASWPAMTAWAAKHRDTPLADIVRGVTA